MTQVLTTEQILIILQGTEQVLRMLQAKSEYREIEACQDFTKSNDFNLLDVIHALGEVQEAIENVQSAQNVDNNSV
ncbi:hypothetical protein [Dendronalium sp. ChiSLP03b]|uniref:hypothetical protein n=1 Tax=Dendronalium sp. ChiSLP03b TaxID=3075381 RepID=UPI00391C6CF3